MINQTILSLYKKFLTYGLVSTDSRKITKNSIFFALKGENFDGNNFALTALKNGANYSIVDNKNISKSDDRIILVNDVIETLQSLSTYNRIKSSCYVIGLTGSNGKTVNFELLESKGLKNSESTPDPLIRTELFISLRNPNLIKNV